MSPTTEMTSPAAQPKPFAPLDLEDFAGGADPHGCPRQPIWRLRLSCTAAAAPTIPNHQASVTTGRPAGTRGHSRNLVRESGTFPARCALAPVRHPRHGPVPSGQAGSVLQGRTASAEVVQGHRRASASPPARRRSAHHGRHDPVRCLRRRLRRRVGSVRGLLPHRRPAADPPRRLGRTCQWRPRHQADAEFGTGSVKTARTLRRPPPLPRRGELRLTRRSTARQSPAPIPLPAAWPPAAATAPEPLEAERRSTPNDPQHDARVAQMSPVDTFFPGFPRLLTSALRRRKLKVVSNRGSPGLQLLAASSGLPPRGAPGSAPLRILFTQRR